MLLEYVDNFTILVEKYRFSALRCSHTSVYALLRCSKIDVFRFKLANFLHTLAKILCLFFLVLSCSYGQSNQSTYYENFWYPQYNSQRLCYCSFDGKQCGLTIASSYCQLFGYEKASHEIISYNVGVTNFINTRAQCQGFNCHGFMVITCKGRLANHTNDNYYRLKQFAYPRYGHYRIAWCYENQKGCGKRAAFSFCRRMGYMRAQEYKKDFSVSATKTLGNHQLCFGKNCAGFKEIICYR